MICGGDGKNLELNYFVLKGLLLGINMTLLESI